MICEKCGYMSENEFSSCPKCENKKETQNAGFDKNDDEVVICVSAKEEPTSETNIAIPEQPSRKKSLLLCGIGILSFFLLFLNYASISVSLLYSTSDSSYSGYGITQCMNGTLGTAARMVVLLIFINIAMIITGIVRYKNANHEKGLGVIMVIESLLMIFSTIIAYCNISSELSEFDSIYSNASVGPGVYLNIALSIISLIIVISINKALGGKSNVKNS